MTQPTQRHTALVITIPVALRRPMVVRDPVDHARAPAPLNWHLDLVLVPALTGRPAGGDTEAAAPIVLSVRAASLHLVTTTLVSAMGVWALAPGRVLGGFVLYRVRHGMEVVG